MSNKEFEEFRKKEIKRIEEEYDINLRTESMYSRDKKFCFEDEGFEEEEIKAEY